MDPQGFQAVDNQTTRTSAHRTQAPATAVPEHLRELFQKATQNCGTVGQQQQVAQLLQDYSSVFSSGDRDLGSTTLIEHSIPIKEGTRPIRQHPHRLGPEKEAEV